MEKFSITLSPNISSSTRIKVYELLKHGESLFQEFFDTIEKEGSLFGNLAAAVRIIEETANLRRYPRTKFNVIQGHSLEGKIYEAKSGNIRIYLYHEKSGRIIITGGKKTTQSKDIKAVIRLIKAYKDEQ